MSITVSISVLSTQPVQALITVQSPDGEDPTGYPVQWAFPPLTEPQTQPAEWYEGSWVTFPGPAYWTECSVGPANGGVSLAVGSYQSRIMITTGDSTGDDVPVLYGPIVEITL